MAVKSSPAPAAGLLLTRGLLFGQTLTFLILASAALLVVTPFASLFLSALALFVLALFPFLLGPASAFLLLPPRPLFVRLALALLLLHLPALGLYPRRLGLKFGLALRFVTSLALRLLSCTGFGFELLASTAFRFLSRTRFDLELLPLTTQRFFLRTCFGFDSLVDATLGFFLRAPVRVRAGARFRFDLLALRLFFLRFAFGLDPDLPRGFLFARAPLGLFLRALFAFEARTLLRFRVCPQRRLLTRLGRCGLRSFPFDILALPLLRCRTLRRRGLGRLGRPEDLREVEIVDFGVAALRWRGRAARHWRPLR